MIIPIILASYSSDLYGYSYSAVQLFADLEDLAAHAVIALDQVIDLVAGIHHGGVIASAELGTDLRQGDVDLFAQQVHGDLARQSDFAGTVAADQTLSVLRLKAAATALIIWSGSIVLRLGSRSARAVLTSSGVSA